jgi:hypothetical protein
MDITRIPRTAFELKHKRKDTHWMPQNKMVQPDTRRHHEKKKELARKGKIVGRWKRL